LKPYGNAAVFLATLNEVEIGDCPEGVRKAIMTAEESRLEESRNRTAHWKRWGPYLSERQWGTVREDYSANGTAWEYFPHDHARSRAYRWGEDGIAGISDRHQHNCFALAMWNTRDPILKERLFGLSGNEGNHGEDVKECYFYLDSTPTHSYMKYLYKYPQAAYPYEQLLEENRRRTKRDPEYELVDTGVFDENRYFDVLVEYAKVSVEEILIRVTAVNRGPEQADLVLLPTYWFRNVWSWGRRPGHPNVSRDKDLADALVVAIDEYRYGKRWLVAEGQPELIFTENETNFERLFAAPNRTPYVKDAFHEYVVRRNKAAVNPANTGTKVAALTRHIIAPGESAAVRLRFTNRDPAASDAREQARLFGKEFEDIFTKRIAEADEFYKSIISQQHSPDAQSVERQALAGMLLTKQSYHYEVQTWLDGDPAQPPPPAERRKGRNHDWKHLYNADVISMPDKWEYPWYAAWDLAFHTVALTLVDPDFAKDQLILLLREWYMNPNGQLPAYEWAFDDVNPPVHAWAAWRVYKIEKRIRGCADRKFLERVFHKLLLNFTWWVNRKDPQGMNVFEGGFLGLDNIGVFDRSRPLPTGGHMEQSDGTSWMGMFCLNMLAIALELAHDDKAYEDVASKFFEHFVYIAQAMNEHGEDGTSLWDEEDGFYYDALHLPDGSQQFLKVRSMVGLIPLFATTTLEPEVLASLPGFRSRMQWFLDNMPAITPYVDMSEKSASGPRRMLSLVTKPRLQRILHTMLDEQEFLSQHGIRALSRFHLNNPYVFRMDGAEYSVSYEPGESMSGRFGGNSNWRGPIWFPVNFLIIEALQKFHYFFGDALTVECPTDSGQHMTLWEIAAEISRRLTHIFLRGEDGKRPVFGDRQAHHSDPHWRDLVLFYEYFHGDTGQGLGANHQTGWTGLVAKLLEQSGE
jgi:hypothetical protein